MNETYYGVYNTMKKEFQFGICEPSKRKATKKLFKKIGDDAYKSRFEIRPLKYGNPKAEPLLQKMRNKKGKWIKDEKQEHVEITYHCSKCGFKVFGRFECSNYCPNCGAEMESEE